MNLICNEIKYNNSISTLIKNDNKYIYMKYIINKININNFEKLFNNYITNQNKKFDFYYINCELETEADNYLANLEINFHYNTDCINIKSYLFFYTESIGIKFFNINRMIINTISCLCNMNYDYYIKNPQSMLERRMNFIISKNPQLINALDRNKSHPLIRKYSYINEYNKYYWW